MGYDLAGEREAGIHGATILNRIGKKALFSILHISDLHRSPEEPITNASLVAALLADRDRYVLETPEVRVADAIVVSGDLISGAELGAENWTSTIREQYGVAYDFLSSLTDRYIEGDRRRLVVVPGNHDICWNSSYSAMRALSTEEEPKSDALRNMDPYGRFRWSWKDRCAYIIDKMEEYRRRLDAYWDFVERFYGGTSLPFPIDRTRGFNLFEIDEGRILVAAFESLVGNDCFAFQGAIDARAIGECALALRDHGRQYQLQMAVWHHGLYGPPNQTDYMDVKTVHEMIGNGFRLGLHGHQHYSEVGAHYIHLPEEQAMAVVGAGSLCAGKRELPRGTNRQYNVVVIDDDYESACVHIREMGLGNQFGRSRDGAFGGDGRVTLRWRRPADRLGRPTDPALQQARQDTLRAEAAIQAGDGDTAISLLEGMTPSPGTHVRRLYLTALQLSGQWQRLAECLREPTNADEVVLLVHALQSLGDLPAAKVALEAFSERFNLARHVYEQLSERLDIQSAMEG